MGWEPIHRFTIFPIMTVMDTYCKAIIVPEQLIWHLENIILQRPEHWEEQFLHFKSSYADHFKQMEYSVEKKEIRTNDGSAR